MSDAKAEQLLRTPLMAHMITPVHRQVRPQACGVDLATAPFHLFHT